MLLSDACHMREADNAAIAGGMDSKELMLSAAGHVARAALEFMGENRKAVVFCGSGNNGGDGIAAAEYLIREGAVCRALLVGSRESMTEDSRAMETRLAAMGGVLEDFVPGDASLAEDLASAGVIIDAIFGVGLNRPLLDKALDAVKLINAAGVPVVSADIASGVSADTGEIMGAAVNASITVTFSLAKTGNFAEPGCVHCGELRVCGIGIPPELVDAAATNDFAVTRGDVRLPHRPRLSHKGDYGKLMIIGGSVGYTGAPNLCARAAVRGGAGLVYLGVPAPIYEICAMKNEEAMPFPLPSDESGRISPAGLEEALEKLKPCDTLVLGPGLGRSAGLRDFVLGVLENCEARMVLDADALFAISGDVSVLARAKKPPVLTPHEGEFRRLCPDWDGRRMDGARAFAVQNNCVLVLKGHRSITAFPDGEAYINTTGGPGMAKGGSGDVLAGVIGALLGQMPLREAVTTAVWLHGRAGDLAAEKYGEYSAAPSDTIAALCAAMKEITE